MSTYRDPQLAMPDIRPRLTPLNQLLAENMLKTTRLYVKRRERRSAQMLAKKSISYWLDQKQHRSKDSSACANSACDRLFAIQELADAIFAHLDFHDTSCCLAVSRTIRHAAQKSTASVRWTLPLIECEDPHLLYVEKQLDLANPRSDWQRQRYFMNTGNIGFPKNAPSPLLISVYDVVDGLGELYQRRITVDMWFSATGHSPKDFTLDGSWLDLALPLPDIVVWIVNITCDCHRTDSFLNELDLNQEVDARVYKNGTLLVFPYKLVTENGDHLRQIAEYAKKAYRMHRHCQNDYGDVSSGLSSITFAALERNQSGFDLLDTSTHSTRPSPEFRAKSPSSIFATTVPQEKTRRKILHDIRVELEAPTKIFWGMVTARNHKLMVEDMMTTRRGTSLDQRLFVEDVPLKELVYTLDKIDRLSTWDRFMGRTEVKLGY
jgi:hypothetical protein